MKDFDNFMSRKRIMKYIKKKIDLAYLTVNKVRRFLHTKKYPGEARIHRIDESFPLKPSLIAY